MDFLNEILANQQEMNMQQQYMAELQQAQMMGMKIRKTSRRDILEYMQQRAGTYDVVLVDDFETVRARHICKGGKSIFVLDRFTENVPTSEGILGVNYFLCPNCKRLIVDKNSVII